MIIKTRVDINLLEKKINQYRAYRALYLDFFIKIGGK